jgi:hypothetical protein
MSDLDAFVRRYFTEYQELDDISQEITGEGQSRGLIPSEPVFALIDAGEIQQAWNLTHVLIDAAPDEEALAFVAASLLEILLRYHHVELGEQIVEAASHDPKVARALGMIYGWEIIPIDLRVRLQRLAIAPDSPTQ